MRRDLAGFGLLTLGALLFSTLGPLARVAYAGGGTPLDLLLVRYTVAAAVLWSALLAARVPLGRGRRATLGLLALGGLYASSAYGVFLGLQHLPVGLTILLFYTYPAWVTLFARLLGEPLGPRRLVALALALGGLALIVGFQMGGADPRWALAPLAAALVVATFVTVSGRVLRGLAPPVLTAHVVAGGALTYLAAGALTGAPLAFSADGWAAAVGIALVPTALALSALMAGLARVGASRAAVVSTLEPLLATVWGALLLGERLTALQLVGGALILGALLLIALAPARRD